MNSNLLLHDTDRCRRAMAKKLGGGENPLLIKR
jgi:hypothetical protein